MYSRAIEDYLREIYELQQGVGQVATGALAEQLGIAPASVTGMVKKLAELNLVAYAPYQGFILTAAGQKIALEVLRHHRLIERFLAEALGVPWDRVHEEAHKIEHVLSADLEERMDVLLGRPTTDPHGSPIPRADGTIEASARLRLAELAAGQTAVVTEVSDGNAELLRYLGELGLYPGTQVSILAVAPLDRLMTIRVGGVQHAVSQAVAREVFVTDVF